MKIKPLSIMFYTALYITGGVAVFVSHFYLDNTMLETGFFVAGILLCFCVMLFQVTIPLKKLACHIEKLKEDPNRVLPENFGGFFAFKELRVIAENLNQHQAELMDLHEDLRSRNVCLIEASRQDPLTHILNRRAFDEDWQYIVRGLEAHVNSISLLLIDCNDFKIINDTYGHEAGDHVLETVASLLNRTVSARRGDRVYRVGGDEFVIMLKNANDNETYGIGARCVEEVASHDFTKFGITNHPVSISVGFASTDKLMNGGLINLKHKADLAMYHSKNTTRRVVQYTAAMGE